MEEEKQKKSWLNTHSTQIIIALFVLVQGISVAWFNYNQKTKDSLTDIKIEQIRRDNDERIAAGHRNTARIYGELGRLQTTLDADRCFVIQPHPQYKYMYLSVLFEVDKNGVSAVKDIFQNIPMSDMVSFSNDMATNMWLYYDDITNQVSDNRVIALMLLAGSTNIAISQLNDASGHWIGSLVVENTGNKAIDFEVSHEQIKNSANLIQYILPAVP